MAEIKLALQNIENPSFTKPEITEKVQKLPQHIQKLKSQVAGHELAIFQNIETGDIMKPIFDVRGIREEKFYRLLFDPKYDQDTIITRFRSFIPKYLGTEFVNGVQFVKLNDLTFNAINPSLMDVKIGAITFDRFASNEKIENELKKAAVSKKLGFRVLALRKWIEEKNDYESIGREFCRDCTAEEEENTISFYLIQQNKDRTIQLINEILRQLAEIRDWFNRDNIDMFEFIGSSIFFVYSFNNNQLDCRAKMIDFAHTYQLQGSNVNTSDDMKDHNFLSGLDAFMNFIKKNLAKL